MAGDLGAILRSVEDGTAANPLGSSMPNGAITTSLEKEKKKARMVFNTKTFYISDDVSAKEFSNFINWIIEPGKGRELLREESTFTQTGELVRICDYLRKAGDTGEDKMDSMSSLDTEEKEVKKEIDITREEPSTEKETCNEHKGERFSRDDYVPE